MKMKSTPRFSCISGCLFHGLAYLLCGLMSTVAQAQAPGQAVKPGQLFAGSLLNAHAPDSAGWIFAGGGSNGMAFARRGAEQDETYAAQIILFKLPPTRSNEEFVEMVKGRVSMTNPAPRFVMLEENYEYTDHRGYPCIRYRGIYDDKEALKTSGAREAMKLQVISLYCRHPTAQEVGFFAAYSHRGANIDPDLEAPAQKFISGVQVPQQAAN